jgi:hypothetical protein
MSELAIYTDFDRAGCPNTRRSTLDYVVFLGNNLVSWSSKCQNVVSPSIVKAEYRAVTNSVAEACWLCQLHLELTPPPPKSQVALVYYDNVGMINLSTNPIQHQCTKHVEIDLHDICKRVAIRDVCVLRVLMTS